MEGMQKARVIVIHRSVVLHPLLQAPVDVGRRAFAEFDPLGAVGPVLQHLHLSGNDFSGSDLFDPCGFLHGRIDGEHALDAQGVSA